MLCIASRVIVMRNNCLYIFFSCIIFVDFDIIIANI